MRHSSFRLDLTITRPLVKLSSLNITKRTFKQKNPNETYIITKKPHKSTEFRHLHTTNIRNLLSETGRRIFFKEILPIPPTFKRIAKEI